MKHTFRAPMCKTLLSIGLGLLLASCGEEPIEEDEAEEAAIGGVISSSGSGGSGDSDEGEESSGALGLTVVEPSLSSSVYGSHEAASLLVLTFSHEGDSVECSTDGGATYGNCTSDSSMVFTVDNHRNGDIIKIKASAEGSEDDVYSFDPSSVYDDIDFYNCDVTYTSDQSRAQIESDFASGSDVNNPYVICIGEGVAINSGGASAIDTGDNSNMVIVGTDSNAGSLEELNIDCTGSAGGNNADEITVAKLAIVSDSATAAIEIACAGKTFLKHLDLDTSASGVAVDMNTYATQVEVEDSTFTTSSNGSSVFYSQTGAGGHNLTVTDSTLETTAANGVDIFFLTSAWANSTIEISGSTITSAVTSAAYSLMYCSSTTGLDVSISDSVLTGRNPMYFAGDTLTIEDSEIRGSQLGISLRGSNTTLNLADVSIIKPDGSVAGYSAIDPQGSTHTINDTSSGDGIIACHEGSQAWAEVLDSGDSTAGSFSTASIQNSGNSSMVCP